MLPLNPTMTAQFILASTSLYRAKLLDLVHIPYKTVSPEYDELPLAGESPLARSNRHAEGKAKSVATMNSELVPSDAIIIGSDQVAFMGKTMFGKPLSEQAAINQLMATSGQWLSFVTAICLYRNRQPIWHGQDRYDIKFRQLSNAKIKWYVDQDRPLDCAGSIKAEGLGLSLIEQMQGRDVNTLYGLPVLLLLDALEELGIGLEDLS
jgi:septum formation protein